jgi:hypothetical protein
MDEQALLSELNEVHRDLLERVQDFTQADFEQAHAVGDWSVKDTFGHLAFWNWEAIRAIDMALKGEPPAPYLVNDAETQDVNAREQLARKVVPLHRVMDDFRRSHKSLTGVIERTPERDLNMSGPHRTSGGEPANATWVAQVVVEHYREHTLQLNQFLERRARHEQ